MSSRNYSRKRAIVIGGSIAGKLSARVLSEFFEEVVVVEKDMSSEKSIPRRSVPQSSQGHVLLKRGEEILEELFPGIIAEMVREGSTRSDFAGNITWFHHGSQKIKYESDVTIVQQSRPFLESHVNRRLNQYTNIKFFRGFKAKGLIVNGQNELKGIQLEKSDGNVFEMLGDIIIDASGAGSRTPQWLEEIGFGRPPKSEVKIDLFYGSRVYKTLTLDSYDWHSLLIYPNPPGVPRGGSISPIEGGKFLVTLLGYGINSVPHEHTTFLHYAKSLDQPGLYEAIKNGIPESEIKIYRFPALRRFHYEKMTQLPDGLLVIGDAICRIDPAFAQGMTLAAMEAMALRELLSKCSDKKKLTFNYYRKVNRIIKIPWLIALTEDYRFLSTVGKKPAGLPLLQWSVKKVMQACSHNKRVYRHFMDVLHLKAHPVSLIKPRILMDVLKKNKTP